MSIFKKLSDRLHYHLDNMKASKLSAQIEQFKYDLSYHSIVVTYRLGRQKLLNKMEILQFEREYFDKLSQYDRFRLTRFSTFQALLINLFQSDICKKESFINYIQEEAKNERLF